MSGDKIYYSNRNLPLITTVSDAMPKITLENYCKWYNVFVIHPDETVETVDGGTILLLGNVFNYFTWIDHVFHPSLLLAIAEYYGGRVDDVVLEAAAGRWVMEDHPLDNFGYFLEDEVIEKIKAIKQTEKGTV